MKKKIQVNVRSVVNAAGIRRDKRNGRDVIIVPSATLPDGIVMNDIRYTAEEIEKSFATLNRKPAPLGHPVVNGKFVSASDPEGIAAHWVGAWNENVRRVNGKVYLDKVIDIENAQGTERGRSVLNAIEKGEPIHTSTGLICNLEPCNDGEAKYNAVNMYFDHDAILLNEEGAGTPEDGVGIFVNSTNGQSQEIEVVNSSAEEAMKDLNWAAESALRAVDRLENAPVIDRITAAILAAVGLSREPQSNAKDDTMDKEELKGLSAQVNSLQKGFDGIGEVVKNAVAEALKPVNEAIDEIKANAAAKDEAEKATLVEKVVKANMLTEEAAKATPLDALRQLANSVPDDSTGKKPAAPLSNSAGGSGKDEWAGYNLNELIDGDKKAA